MRQERYGAVKHIVLIMVNKKILLKWDFLRFSTMIMKNRGDRQPQRNRGQIHAPVVYMPRNAMMQYGFRGAYDTCDFG